MRKAFTLAELLVGVTILSVMTVALFEIYAAVSGANRRLDRARELTAAVRAVTEDLARDVRDREIDFSQYGKGAGKTPTEWSGSGANVLFLSGGVAYRHRQSGATADFVDCPEAGTGACFLTRRTADGKEERLTSELVSVKSLKFFVSGGAKDGGGAPGKVTLAADVDLLPQYKENPSEPSAKFQTTVAERPYNRNQPE